MTFATTAYGEYPYGAMAAMAPTVVSLPGRSNTEVLDYPTAPVWTFFAIDIATDIILEQLPLESVKYTKELNESGGLAATVRTDIVSSSGYNKVNNTVLIPGRTYIAALRDGNPQFIGILWSVKMNTSNNSMSIAVGDMLSYIERRYVRTSFAWAADTRMDAINDVLVHLNATANALNVPIASYTDSSAVTFSRKVFAYEREEAMKMISEISEIKGGIDYMIEPTGTQASGLSYQFIMKNRIGINNRAAQFIGGHNCEISYGVDAFDLVNQVTMFGTGSGAAVKRKEVTDTDSITAGYPLLQETESRSKVSNRTKLEDIGENILYRRGQPVEEIKIAVPYGAEDVGIGNYSVGDTVYVTAKDGWLDLQSRRFRILKQSVTISDDGGESVTLDGVQVNSSVFTDAGASEPEDEIISLHEIGDPGF